MEHARNPWIGLAASALPGGDRSLLATGPARAVPRQGGAVFDGRPRAIDPSAGPVDLRDASASPAAPLEPASPAAVLSPEPASLPPSPSLSRDPSRSTSLAEAAERSERASAAGVKPWRLRCFAKARHIARVGFALFGHACASVLYAVTWMAPVGTRDVYEASRHNLRQAWEGVDPLARPAMTSAVAPAPPADGRFAGLIDRMKQAQARYRQAVDQAKVDFAKKAFYMKCLDVALGAAAVAVAVTVAVMSGGAALAIPAVIVTGVLLYWAVADWQCARHNLEAAREGRPQLPMGNNALANTLYRYHTEVQGMAPEQARQESAVTAGITSALVAGVSLAMGVAISVPVRVGISITRFVIGGFYRLHSAGEFALAQRLASRQREIGRDLPTLDASRAHSLDDEALEPLLELLKAQGLVGSGPAGLAAPDLPSPLSHGIAPVDASEFGDGDEDDLEADDVRESEALDGATSDADADDSDPEWLSDGASVSLPRVDPPQAFAPRALTAREADLLARWVQTTPSVDPLLEIVADPALPRRASRFEAFLSELARKEEAGARLAAVRFAGVNGIYLTSFLRGLVTFCLAR